jgi:CO/xanthine dehydrogenase FAD-binding subunit
MPIIHEFEYIRPTTLADALKALSKHKDAAVLAGGTDLVCNIKEGTRAPAVVVDIKNIAALRAITFTNNTLRIGALVTFNDVIESPVVKKKFPLIVETAGVVASVGIRNRATIAGNICSSVPCMDSGPLLAAYEAVIHTKSLKGSRAIRIRDFFLAPRTTALKKGELVTAISIPLPHKKHAGCYVKLRRYEGEDLAQASVLVMALPGNQYRVAFGSVAPVPIRAARIESLLNGNEITPGIIKKAQALVADEIAPITDIRATREYRLHMARIMFERGLKAAVARLNGAGPAYCTSVI